MDTVEDTLLSSLKELGINQDNYGVLALLPLVLVAWSDGKVQKAEKVRVLEIAHENGFLVGGEDVLKGWLDREPTRAYYDTGFEVLIELARRERGVGTGLNADSLQELLDLSMDVAKAAGGLFGKAFTVCDAERAAMNSLAGTLSVDDGASWQDLLAELD